MKKDDIKAKTEMVVKRYGATTGASSGGKPAPKAKVTIRPTGGLKMNGLKIKVVKKF